MKWLEDFLRNKRVSNKQQRQRYMDGAIRLREEAEKETDPERKTDITAAAETLEEGVKEIDHRKEIFRTNVETVAENVLAPASAVGIPTKPVVHGTGQVGEKLFDILTAPEQSDD